MWIYVFRCYNCKMLSVYNGVGVVVGVGVYYIK